MALQQFVCCVTVLIIFFCKGCHLDQPACGSRAVNSSNSAGVHDAAPGSWPWFAVIHYFDEVVNLFSAGSLINDQWVLTDAYIPTNFPSALSSMVVYLGRNSRSGPDPNEVNRTVVNTTCHPGLNPSTRENYICLMKLSAPVNFTDYIRPICLASQNSTFNNETSSWIISFDASRNNLLEANVPIVGNNECKASNPWITDSIICAGDTEPCFSSFGAPLMTQSGSVWLQSGVLIRFGCSEGPLVYTPVSPYQKWISDTVTGTPPGFVTFPSPDSSLQTTASPTAAPTAPPTAAPTASPTASPTAPPTAAPTAPPTAAPTAPPTAAPTAAPTAPPTTPPTAAPTSPTCVGVFCSGENLIHFTHFTSLCVLVVLLHVFAATVGN